jgi:hypothetical protein
MGIPKRATIYFEPSLHKALKLRAVETEASVSDIVNEAVQELLSENHEDLMAFDARKSEPSSDFTEFVKQLKRDGKI